MEQEIQVTPPEEVKEVLITQDECLQVQFEL